MSQSAAATTGGEEEIDEIMQEIRSLQEGITKVSDSGSTPETAEASTETGAEASATTAPHLTLVPSPEDTASTAEAETDMSDFHTGAGASDEHSLEETMARMKADPEVKTLLDESSESEEESVSDQELADVIDQITEESQSSENSEDGLTFDDPHRQDVTEPEVCVW